MTVSRRNVLIGTGAGLAALTTQQTSAAVLPQGLDKSRFMDAVSEYQALLGAENVIVDEEKLAPYEVLSLPGPITDFQSAGALIVSSVEQVQKVLAICNKYIVPVWPISTGFNVGYGNRLPAVPGQMVLDLSRMNKIINVDPELCTALVEPGTTYAQLYEYITVNKLPLWLSVPGPGPLVGPMGNTLERGLGYTSIGVQYESICGMEVVLADGSIVQTGMGGVAGSTGWQAYKYGYGPVLDGIFTQSNFGIVTKLGIWLTPKPEKLKMFMVTFPGIDDLEKAVEAQRILKLANTVQGPILSGLSLAGFQMTGPRINYKKDKSPITKAWFLDYTKANGMPVVASFGSICGSEGEVAAKYAEIKRVYGEVGGTVIDELLFQLAPSYEALVASNSGVPTLNELQMMNWVPGGGIIWMAFVVPARGKEVKLNTDLGWEIMEKHGFDYNGGFFSLGRGLLHAMSILFDKGDPEEDARAKACADELLNRFAEKGFAPYRATIQHMARTAEIYGGAQQAINLKIKNALDPNGIIGRGKSGILA